MCRNMSEDKHKQAGTRWVYQRLVLGALLFNSLCLCLLYFFSFNSSSAGNGGLKMIGALPHSSSQVLQHGAEHAAALDDSAQHNTAAAATPGDIRLFTGVLSAAANVEARQAIRDTWGAHPLLVKSRVMFFVLRPRNDTVFRAVRQEAVATGDIFMTSEVYEGYYNITYAVLDIFKVAATMSNAYTHVAKTDDDCFVRPQLLLDALAGMPRQYLYAGSPMEAGGVIRSGSWHKVPYSNWASDKPVRYGYGAGYVLSMDLAQEIAAGAAHVIMPANNLLVIEDVAVGYWVEHVGRELGVEINYNASVTRGDPCQPDLMFVHIREKPQWQVLRCMHTRGGQCCPAANGTSGA